MTAKKDTALAIVEEQPTDLAVYAADDLRGRENVTIDDLKLSRLAIAQKMSPEVDPEKPAQFIEGLKVGELFDTVTQQIYGPGPVKFTIIRPVHKHAKVLDKDGNVIEWDVPWDDPRCEFTTNEKGERVPPVATRFYDFYILLNDDPSFPITLSMKRTQVPVAKLLITRYSRQQGGPIFAHSYAVRTVSQEGAHGPFKNYVINPAGVPSAEVGKKAEEWFARLQKVKVVVQQGGDDDKVPF